MPERRVARDYEKGARPLGHNVRAVREARGLTQDQLAGITGIHRNQIQNIELSRNNARDPQTGRPGPGNPQLDTIFLLPETLRVDIAYLIDPSVSVQPVPG